MSSHCPIVQEQLRRHSNIRVHLGKIKVWNASGVEPGACQILQRIADASGNRESVWKGSGLPTELQGIKVLGTPLGHPDFVAAHLDRVLSDHRTLLERIPAVQDVQCAWALLLHNACGRANYQVRVVRPALTEAFAMGHDEGLWRCMCEILRVLLDTGVLARDTASLPLALGGLGLRSAVRSRQSAYWASWADTLPMVRMRHRAIAESFVEALVTGVCPVSLVEAEDCRRNLTGVMGFEPPSWPALAAGARPPPPPLDDPGGWRTGWQHEAASRVFVCVSVCVCVCCVSVCVC